METLKSDLAKQNTEASKLDFNFLNTMKLKQVFDDMT